MLPRIIPSKKSDPGLYPYRYGLVFGFFNALTWQVAINTPMVLALQWLGATSFQVGLAYAFVFVLTPVQIVSTSLLPRFGFRRVMLSGWGARAVFVAIPLLLAVAAPDDPVRGGWMVNALVTSVFFFCLLRAIGQCAFAPWIYDLMPHETSGRYFAADQYVSGVGGVVTLLACTAFFAYLPVREAVGAAYAVALVGSLAAFFALRRMPDGEKPAPVSVWRTLRDTPRHILQASVFRDYLWLSVLFAIVLTPVPPFSAYYLKVVPRFSGGGIMALEVCRYFGVILVAGLMQKQVDRHGARPYLAFAAWAHVIIALYWLIGLSTGHVGMAGLALVYFFVGGATAASIAGNLNYLSRITPPGERTLMVTVHAAVIAVAGGASSGIWGYFLKQGVEGQGISVRAFETFFVTVLVVALVLIWRIARLPESLENKGEPLPLGSAILRPFRVIPFVGGVFGTEKGRKP